MHAHAPRIPWNPPTCRSHRARGPSFLRACPAVGRPCRRASPRGTPPRGFVVSHGGMRSPASLHWPEYLIEAAGLGLFMVSAGAFAVGLFHPASPVTLALPDPLLRRALMGAAMGLTAIGLIYSPW